MIEVQSLSKGFGGRPVLRDVALEVREGEALAIIGRSGSGKSVLLKHLIGLLRPDAGRVVVDEEPLDALPYAGLRRVRRKFGVLFQGGALFDSMTAAENVAFPLRTLTELTPSEIRQRVEECLRVVELPDVGAKRPSELSGGMQKRVALARAIAAEPKYLLYDEPTSGLDPETSQTINDLIARLARDFGVTSVVISHDMHSVLQVADHVAFIHEGRLHWSGPVAALAGAGDPVLSAFIRANEYQIGETAPTSRSAPPYPP